ncbi:hypothetical protein LCGC14_1903340 [marine sediment metagenome]|uniref:Uncharacterized protein n=1 Tax=marine sediment metagenome TaxID=412755 RepID=A0A0F9GJ68_9ZZZZ
MTVETPANPLPDDKVEGDSAETEIWDDNDTPPGIDPRTGEDHRPEAK